MKKLMGFRLVIAVASLLLLGRLSIHSSLAASTITPFDAIKHVGEYVTVQGQVTQVHVSRKGNIFLNMGGRYPRNAFTAVIFSGYASSFPDAGNFSGKHIRVAGFVKLYRGKPEIVITSRSQIGGS